MMGGGMNPLLAALQGGGGGMGGPPMMPGMGGGMPPGMGQGGPMDALMMPPQAPPMPPPFAGAGDYGQQGGPPTQLSPEEFQILQAILGALEQGPGSGGLPDMGNGMGMGMPDALGQTSLARNNPGGLPPQFGGLY